MRNAVGAMPGDTVELDLPPNAVLGLSVLVWVVPLVGLIGGAVAGAVLPWGGIDRDVTTLFGAVAGAAFAYGLLRGIDRQVAAHRRLTPFIARVVRRVIR